MWRGTKPIVWAEVRKKKWRNWACAKIPYRRVDDGNRYTGTGKRRIPAESIYWFGRQTSRWECKEIEKRTESILQQTHTAIIRTQRDEHRTLNHVLHRHKQQPSNRERQVNQHRRMYQCSQCSYIVFLLYPKQRTVFSNYEHCPIYPRRAHNTHTHTDKGTITSEYICCSCTNNSIIPFN